jgi:hypothetical protein
MGIDFRGSIVTPRIVSDPVDAEYVFAFINNFRSKHRVNILRLVAITDSLEVSVLAGYIMPLLKTFKCSASDVSGGIEIFTKCAWDTEVDNSDSAIRLFYSSLGSNDRISVTDPGGAVWQQYTQRGTTGYGQQRTLDNSLLTKLTCNVDFVIDPGEALVVQWRHATGPVGGELFLNLAWEEDELLTNYTIGGVVKREGDLVENAKIFLLTDNTVEMTNPEVDVVLSEADGTWSAKISSGVKVAAFVQYKDGDDLYTDSGKPFIEEE